MAQPNQQNQAGRLPTPRLGDIFQQKFNGDSSGNPYSHWLKWKDFCELYKTRFKILRTPLDGQDLQ